MNSYMCMHCATHMQSDKYWVLPGRGVYKQQYKAHCAPHTQGNEDDGDEGKLPVSHGGGAG